MKKTERKTCTALPPSELDLMITCSHSKRCLLKAGINTLEQLRSLSRDDLLHIRGIGPVIADGILNAKAQHTPQPDSKESDVSLFHA